MQVKVKKLHEDAVIPFKAHKSDAGFDLFAVKDTIIWPFGKKKVETGIAIELPPGYELQVRPRSGLSLKTNTLVIFGTVDSGYRGEIGIIMTNIGNREFYVNKGDKIAQAVIQKIPDIELVEADELDDGERQESGFGSTGV